MLEKLRQGGFQVGFYSHAEAILSVDFPEAVEELTFALGRVSIPIEDLVRSGGGEAKVTQSLRRELTKLEWKKHEFVIKKLIDGRERESISHWVDHVRSMLGGKIALEIEWNNKDPFFDRDLENFKRLHAEGAISVGIIVTRGVSLQERIKSLILAFAKSRKLKSLADLSAFELTPTPRQRKEIERRMAMGEPFHEAWANMFCNDKYGQATTHWRKLEDRVHRGVGNPCPLLLIGIPDTVITP